MGEAPDRMTMIVAAARMVVRAEDDAVAEGRYGLLDSVDNDGVHYQSAHLAGAMTILRELLKPAPVADGPPTTSGDSHSEGEGQS